MERDALLVDNVHAVNGEQVDGRGQLDAQIVRSAIRSAVAVIRRPWAVGAPWAVGSVLLSVPRC